MEKSSKKKAGTLLAAMEEVVNFAKIYSLKEKFFELASRELDYISSKLGIARDEAMLLAFFIEKSSSCRIWLSSIADMVNVSNIRIISMMNVADGLVKKGYLRGNVNGKDERYYSVPREVLDAVRKNECFTPKPMLDLTTDEFFDRLEDIFREDDMPFWNRHEMLEDLVESNLHLPYCKAVKKYDLGSLDNLLLHVFANRLINDDDDNIGTGDWEDYMDSKSMVRRVLKNLKNGHSRLTAEGILEPVSNDGVRDANLYHLSNRAKDTLFPDMDIDHNIAGNDKFLTPYASFPEKKLYYAPHVQADIDRLGQLLQPDQFKMVAERLNENGMRKGFACLFYGSPGTGKTETANQLARMTGRDVLMVDVTKIKSCWVGESEQNIKALFDRYRKCVKEKEVAPILLFNEADAVLGIRQEGARRAVDKMENSIQNIILQEMETLEGIMIATTNLTCNLDTAFERRFIYKIKFERPTVEAKRQIWKSMIPSMSDGLAQSLAKDFDLSGGQIENVARKRTVEYILSGQEPSDDQMREYCISESLDSKQSTRSRIGF